MVDTFISGISTTGTWGDVGSYLGWYNGQDTQVVRDYSTNQYSAWTSDDGMKALSKLDDNNRYEFAVKENGYGTILGLSAISSDRGAYGVGSVNEPEQREEISYAADVQCWCKVTGLIDSTGTEYTLTGTKWTYLGNLNGTEGSCQNDCALRFYNTASFRNTMLNAATVVRPIKVATTKYVENAFADSVTELNTAISTVKTVVDNTLIQADRIGKLYTGKQNRPDDSSDSEKCPDGKLCLLITEADGSLHWYPIATGSDVSSGSSSSFDVSAFIAAIPTTADSTWGDESYYRYDRSGGTATVMDMYAGGETTSSITLTAGEWRVKKNGTGTIYGTSACNREDGSVWYENGVFTKTTDQTDSGGQYCWCKMTRVEDTNGNGDDTDEALWVFTYAYNYGYEDSCTRYCAFNCAFYGVYRANFRGVMLGTSN